MVAINKSEKDLIAERFPNVHIVRTMKQRSKRHRYYCEETKSVMRLLDKLRGVPEPKAKEVPRYTKPNRKKRKRDFS